MSPSFGGGLALQLASTAGEAAPAPDLLWLCRSGDADGGCRVCCREVTTPSNDVDQLFTVELAVSRELAAEWLGTSPRFVRRLIAERRICFTRLGRHVRIAASDLDAYVAAGRVEPALRRSS
jgi:excisionase family DNA binding protein